MRLRSIRVIAALAALGCAAGRDMAAARHTLVVAFGADEAPVTLNRERLGRYPLNASICETLVALTSDFRVAPSLASRWEPLSPDGVRFHLRPGVTFSDGSPLVAGDVVYTLVHAARLRLGYSFLAESSARAIDDSTVEVRATRPNRRLLEQLVHPTYGVMSPRGDPARRPLCTGPFRLVDYSPHDHLTVVRNERYAGARARMDTIVFRFIPDENTRALALRAGDADVIYDVGRENTSALSQVAGLHVVTAPPGAVLVLYINRHGAAPYDQLADSALRRAVALALDRRTLVERVIGLRAAAVVSTVNPPSVLGEHASLVRGVPHDATAARRIIAAAPRRPLRLIFQPGAVNRPIAEYVQSQLSRVGLSVTIESLDAAAFETRLNSGAFDLDLEVPSQNDANPAFLLALRWYSRSGTRSVAFTGASARFDTLVERALQAPDVSATRRAAGDAMHQLVDVEVGAIPLAGLSRSYAMRGRVRGFVAHPSRLNQSWSGVWLAR